jgi:hypothetical protein
MNTNKKNNITYLECYMALKIIKDKFGIKTTKGYFAGFTDETKKDFAETLMKF